MEGREGPDEHRRPAAVWRDFRDVHQCHVVRGLHRHGTRRVERCASVAHDGDAERQDRVGMHRQPVLQHLLGAVTAPSPERPNHAACLPSSSPGSAR